MATLLIVDDEPEICATLCEIAERQGWQPVSATRLDQARGLAAENDYDVILLDVNLPDGNGLNAISHFTDSTGKPEVIIITGRGCPDAAGLALQHGAWDYIEKPISIKKIVLPVQRALEYRLVRKAAGQRRLLKRDGIIGSSPAINDCLEQLAEAADGDHNVLLYGETGTGKELFARTIHFNSCRRDRNFIVVDCATLTAGLIESILFGHVKGAFTDATRDREGLVRLADKGTLFLDEVGELPLDLQKKFLGVLENRWFRPVGSTTETVSDFRLIAATNRNLEAMTEQGRFREDLLYRIKSQKLVVPPLRNRKEDIFELVSYYLAQFCRRRDVQPKICQPEFMRCLCNYTWPGNIRELVNVLDMVVSTTRDDQILFHKHLPVDIRLAGIEHQTDNTGPAENSAESVRAAPAGGVLRTWQEFRKSGLKILEREYLVRLLDDTQGDIRQMTVVAGMGKSRVYELLDKHGLSLKKPH